MATLINRDFRTYQVKSMLDKYAALVPPGAVDAGENIDYLYMMLGKDTIWNTGDEAIPDALVNNDDLSALVWAENIVLSRVNSSNIQPVVRRVDFSTTNPNFVQFDTSNPLAYDTDFYCVNSKLEVFECVTSPNIYGSGSTPVVEPVFDDASLSPIYDTEAGWQWKFLYQISVADEKMITRLWMPVNYGSNLITTNDVGRTNVDDFADSIHKLGATDLMLFNIIELKAGFGDTVGVSVNPDFASYRRVALLNNPLDATLPTDLLKVVDVLSSAAVLDSGEVIYTENRTVIFRALGQTEEVRLILAY